MNNKGLLTIVGVLAGLFVLYKILEKFGLVKTKEQIQQEKDEKAAGTTQGNPWSPLYWKSVKGASLISKATANAYADQIAKSIGNFWDDENGVYSVLRKLKYKTQLSWLSQVFNDRHKADLFNYLERNFSDKEIGVCISIANDLK